MNEKTQFIRLIDIFVLGPFMIVAAGKQKEKYFRAGLALGGLATILYNARNYLQNRG